MWKFKCIVSTELEIRFTSDSKAQIFSLGYIIFPTMTFL